MKQKQEKRKQFTADYKTLTLSEMVEKWGISKSSVQRKAKELGISKGKRGKAKKLDF